MSARDPRDLNPPRYINEPDTVGTGTITAVTAATGLECTPTTITSTGTIGLAALGADPSGTYGDDVTSSQVTVDAYGRVTAAADVPIVLPSQTVGALPQLDLAASGSFTVSAYPFMTFWNIPTMSLTLAAGTYLLGFNATALTDGYLVLVPHDGAAIVDSMLSYGMNATSDFASVSRTNVITIGSTTTFTLQAGYTSAVAVIERYNMWSVKIA